jgi:hypothetical protein
MADWLITFLSNKSRMDRKQPNVREIKAELEDAIRLDLGGDGPDDGEPRN